MLLSVVAGAGGFAGFLDAVAVVPGAFDGAGVSPGGQRADRMVDDQMGLDLWTSARPRRWSVRDVAAGYIAAKMSFDGRSHQSPANGSPCASSAAGDPAASRGLRFHKLAEFPGERLGAAGQVCERVGRHVRKG